MQQTGGAGGATQQSGTGGYHGVSPLPHPDAAADGPKTDGSVAPMADAARDAGDAGGGPLFAPPLPAAWV